MDFEAMASSSPEIQSLKPKGPTKRNAIRRETATSKQDISADTDLSSPAKITNVNNRDKSFNETGENRPLARDKDDDSEKTDDDEQGKASVAIKVQQSRQSVEPETIHQKASQSPVKTSAPKETKQPPKNAFGIVSSIFLALAVIVLAWAVIAFSKNRLVPTKETTARQSCKNFLQLHAKYPNMDDMLWTTLIVGVERAVNDPGEPATFIFLYNSSTLGQSLLDDVIRITIECFGNNADAIWRKSDDFKSAELAQDYGMVLDRHREELQSQGVLVVRDLDQVPPNAAQVFFTICDSYEPLVRKAAIFFTIDISQRAASQSAQLSPTSIAEGILKDLWRQELHSNVLDPLVVRLTENVFKLD